MPRCPFTSRTSASEWQPNARPKDILNQSGGIICLRAGHGDYKDKYFDSWRSQVANAKLVMVYLFMDTKDGDGRKNADWLIKWVGGKRMPNEVFVADIEPGGGNWTVSQTRAFHDRVRSQLGGPPVMTYANESYAKARASLFTSDTGWVAKWGQPGKDASRPTVPHIVWQHAADGYGKPRVHWAGCSKQADENRVDGYTQAAFAAKLLGTSTTPQPPPPLPAKSSDCCS